MPLHPLRLSEIELQRTVVGGPMCSFADVAKLNLILPASIPAFVGLHRDHGNSHRVPGALLRQTAATLRVTEVAKLPQFLPRRNLAFMPGRSAMSAPSTT